MAVLCVTTLLVVFYHRLRWTQPFVEEWEELRTAVGSGKRIHKTWLSKVTFTLLCCGFMLRLTAGSFNPLNGVAFLNLIPWVAQL